MSMKPELLRLRDKVVKVRNELWIVWDKFEDLKKELDDVEQNILDITKEIE